MNALHKDRLKVRELRELVKEMSIDFIEDERDIPKVKFKNCGRDCFGAYSWYTNTIYLNPSWNGIDTPEFSYTFLHEFVHFIQFKTDTERLISTSDKESHDWRFIHSLFKLITKYGIKEHYGKLLEEVFFYRFKWSREKFRRTTAIILCRKYKNPIEDYYNN